MHHVIRLACTGLILFCPISLNAGVVINEIAWMGTETSANDEWIELFNSGEADVSLDGWILTDAVGLEIPLTGSIGSGEYAVLERTDDSSVFGTAFLIYTGGLGNDGRTLSLLRGDGSLEDQVAGGADWEQIGGDNASKETAQRTNAGWVTAIATPGYANSDEVETADTATEDEQQNNEVAEADDTETNAAQTDIEKKRNSGKGMVLTLPNTQLLLEISGPDVAFVNQPVSFSVHGSGLGKTWIDSLVYQWNFGDMHGASGVDVQHTFMHPGTYVVVASGSFSRHTAAVRHEITVLPVSFSITRAADGDVQIHNDAVYEVDVSGLSVVGDDRAIFPPHTIMLPHSTITIPKERLEHGVRKMIAVYDQGGDMLASSMPQVHMRHHAALEDADVKAVAYQKSVVDDAGSAPNTWVVSRDVPETVTHSAAPLVTSAIDGVVSEIIDVRPTNSMQAHMSNTNEWLPYVGLIGVIVIGVLALYIRPTER